MAASPFHPDLRRVARVLPRAVVGRRTLPLLRAGGRLLAVRRPRDVELARVSEHAVVRVHRPHAARRPGPALLWVHGGGLVFGTAQQDDGLCRRFARELGIVVVSVDYRHAPEHPFPAALDDCWAALEWLRHDVDVDPGAVAVGGASAGGGLAAALALRARAADADLAFQLLVYPMLDDRTVLRTDLDARHVRAWNPAANELGWGSYLGGAVGTQDVPALAAAARATDLEGLPPAWVGVGSLDLFHDEDVAYAERLRTAGVPCRLEVVPGAFHGFDVLAPWTGVSRAFVRSQVDALREGLALG